MWFAELSERREVVKSVLINATNFGGPLPQVGQLRPGDGILLRQAPFCN